MRALAGLACVAFLGSGPQSTPEHEAIAQSCASGKLEDCRRLALHAELNRAAGVDLEAQLAPVFDKARHVFTLACDRGDASDSGCFGAGTMHALKGHEELARAVTFYERSCDGGYADGCIQLGNAYTSGIAHDVPWDIQRALAAYERACSAGNADGCTIVAKTLEGAADIPPDAVRRVPRDLKRAASLYQKACDLGAMRDCLRLAEMHDRGLGVRKDAARASKLYARACEGGVTEACGRARTGK